MRYRAFAAGSQKLRYMALERGAEKGGVKDYRNGKPLISRKQRPRPKRKIINSCLRRRSGHKALHGRNTVKRLEAN